MTMTSSVLIMLFTFGALLATNSGLRGALLRYDKEKSDNKQLRLSNQQLRTEQKALQGNVQTAQQQAARARKIAETAQKQAVKAHDNYQNALEQLKQKQDQLQSAQGAERVARSNERQARSGEEAARNRAARAGRDLQKKQNELGRVNGRLTLAQKNLKSLQSDLRVAQGNVRQAQGKLKEVQGRLVTDQARYLEAARKSLEEERELRAQINHHSQEISELQSQKESLDNDIKQLEVARNQLARPFQGDVDVPQGAVYAERLIAPRTSAGESTVQLRAMLAEGRDEVAKENQKRVVKLLLKDGQELPQELIINKLAEFLEGSPVPSSVRLSALRNHAKAETEIQCAFLVVPARVAFRKNQVIASKLIDGSQSDARIFNQLLYDLLNAGELAANEKSVVPILRGGAKLYADGTNERLFQALRRIQAIGKPVEVRLLADDDLTTIEQLHVRFEIVNPPVER
jgi:uncharacterized protein (DUF3084 family)